MHRSLIYNTYKPHKHELLYLATAYRNRYWVTQYDPRYRNTVAVLPEFVMQQSRVRKRVRSACERCRKQKLKVSPFANSSVEDVSLLFATDPAQCDQERPCSLCLRANKACIPQRAYATPIHHYFDFIRPLLMLFQGESHIRKSPSHRTATVLTMPMTRLYHLPDWTPK